MLTNLLIDSFLFWSFLILTIGFAIYTVRVAIKMHNYEKQVNRGWDDLIERADRMIVKLDDIIFEINKIKKENKKNI